MPAFYQASIEGFLADEPQRILGELTAAYGDTGFTDLKNQQVSAWKIEIPILKKTFAELVLKLSQAVRWAILFEYPIPRRQRRIDVVILAEDLIFCIEFKTQDRKHNPAAIRQVEDYTLDLRDFHEESRGRRIIPVVVVPQAHAATVHPSGSPSDLVGSVGLANANNLAEILAETFCLEHDSSATPIDPERWARSAYRPVPTIIEAAEALYAGHDVREIAQHHSDNLTGTANRVLALIRRAQEQRQKVICFVTGIPGAGKTLAGLNVVHNPALRQEGRPPGVFLSGNGPLVRILSAALARDFKRRTCSMGGERHIRAMVQNVHTFVRAALEKTDVPPAENVIIFDEAQRAWDAKQTLRKTGREESEPEILLSIMDRHEWAVVVALVGGGQEINVGEAGLAEWGNTLQKRFTHWQVVVSPRALQRNSSLAGQLLFANGETHGIKVEQDPTLHLDVCLRSFRAQKMTDWVDAVLAGDTGGASAIMAGIQGFPVRLTRSLPAAKMWLRSRARGFRRCGLAASSGALRLRRYGLELSSGFRHGNRDLYVQWFLANPDDVRSSNQLEVAASEFECQGLELDWVGLCWGGDFTWNPVTHGWLYRQFKGSRWGQMRQMEDRRYCLNTYRVLLTRAREGMVIWIPAGDPSDETNLPGPFDATAAFLKECGVPDL